jgi:hypothetical protein
MSTLPTLREDLRALITQGPVAFVRGPAATSDARAVLGEGERPRRGNGSFPLFSQLEGNFARASLAGAAPR